MVATKRVNTTICGLLRLTWKNIQMFDTQLRSDAPLQLAFVIHWNYGKALELNLLIWMQLRLFKIWDCETAPCEMNFSFRKEVDKVLSIY